MPASGRGYADLELGCRRVAGATMARIVELCRARKLTRVAFSGTADLATAAWPDVVLSMPSGGLAWKEAPT